MNSSVLEIIFTKLKEIDWSQDIIREYRLPNLGGDKPMTMSLRTNKNTDGVHAALVIVKNQKQKIAVIQLLDIK